MTTPCLVIDLATLHRNIETAALHCHKAGLAFRPHAKTHKCVAVARKQLDAGARGICVANMGEAEVFAAGGIDDILITSPLVSDDKFARLLRLLGAGSRVAVVIDKLDVARRLAVQARQTGLVVPVYLDIDMGRHRTGVCSSEAAAELGSYLCQESIFEFVGLQAYAGQLSHMLEFAGRAEAARTAAEQIRQICTALWARSIRVREITGGSTGTIVIDAQIGVYTELQYGSYIFTDVEYEAVDLDGKGGRLFEPSLFVRTTVISNNWPGMVTTDAGYKHFAGNTALPRTASSGGPSGQYRPQSDEHGTIYLSCEDGSLELGSSIECLVPHCDPTVNLYDYYHVVEGNILVDIWPIGARGAF